MAASASLDGIIVKQRWDEGEPNETRLKQFKKNNMIFLNFTEKMESNTVD